MDWRRIPAGRGLDRIIAKERGWQPRLVFVERTSGINRQQGPVEDFPEYSTSNAAASELFYELPIEIRNNLPKLNGAYEICVAWLEWKGVEFPTPPPPPANPGYTLLSGQTEDEAANWLMKLFWLGIFIFGVLAFLNLLGVI